MKQATLLVIGLLLLASAGVAQQGIARRPNIHFELEPFDVSMSAGTLSGQGEVILRAASARLVRINTATNARTDLEIQLDTQGNDATLEFIVAGQSEVRLNTVGKTQQILSDNEPFAETTMVYPVGSGISELVSIDRPIKLSDIENYLKGLPAGLVAVSACVVHEANLSILVTCPNAPPTAVHLGVVRWTRNYVITGECDAKTGRLNNRHVVPDVDRPELDEATFLSPEPE